MLKDGFFVEGSEIVAFEEETQKMVDCTKLKDVTSVQVEFLAYCSVPSAQRVDAYPFYRLTEESIERFLNGESLSVSYIKKTYAPDLLEECVNTSQLLCIVEGEKYLVSEYAIPTLTLRASVGGDKTINRVNLIRNLHLADAFFSKENGHARIIYREDGNNIKKIFAFLGNFYHLMPQTILGDVVNFIEDEAILGKMEVKEWKIDHRFSHIYVEFPEGAEDFIEMYDLPDKIVPGVSILTSDTGCSSLSVRGTYRIKGTVITSCEYLKKHNAEIKAEDILKTVDEKIFTDVRKLPETLVRLMSPILDYSKIDIKTEEGGIKHLEKFKDLAEETLLKCVSDIGKKRIDAILEQLMEEIAEDMPYSFYDVAIILMDLENRVTGLDRETESNFRKGLAKIPYVLEKLMKKEDIKLV